MKKPFVSICYKALAFGVLVYCAAIVLTGQIHAGDKYSSSELNRARHYVKLARAPEPHEIGQPSGAGALNRAPASADRRPAGIAYQVAGNHRLPLEYRPAPARSRARVYTACQDANGGIWGPGNANYRNCMEGPSGHWNPTSPSNHHRTRTGRAMLIAF